MLTISKRILILCEDKKSSLNYLDSFKKDERLKRDLSAVNVEIYQPTDFSPLGLVLEAKRRKKRAKQERNKFSEIWIVFDRDGHANIPKAIDMAIANDINVAISIVCFEYWVLLHYERTTRAFNKCEEVLTYIRKNHYSDYQKNSDCYTILREKTQTAIENGEWLEKQKRNEIERGEKYYEFCAYTNIHNLVKKLFDPKNHLYEN